MSSRPPLAFIFAVTLTGILSNTLVTPAIPDILADLGMPSDRSGLLVSVGSVAGIVLAPAIGFLADRYGRRRVLIACLAVFGTFGLAAALAPTFGFLLAARFLQGVGSAGLINLAVVLIGDHWSGAERTRLVGRNSAVLTVGLALLPLLSGALTQAFGWRVTFALYTVAFLTAGWTWITLDEVRPETQPAVGAQLREAARAATQPVTATTVGLAFLVFVLIFGSVLTVLPVHLAEVFGLGAASRGVFISLPALTSTITAFNLGRIRNRLSPHVIVGLTAAAWVVAFATLGLAASLMVIAIGALVFGAGEGALVPLLQDVAIAAAPERQRGAVVAIWVGFARFGQTVGPLLAGLGLATIGSGATLVAGASVALMVSVVGLAGPFRAISTPSPAPRR